MALTAPVLTWELETEAALSPTNNAAELLSELKTMIAASATGWRVLDDDVLAGDTYLWIGAPAASPNADDRLFIYAGGGTLHAANIDSKTVQNASGIYAGYCPGHGGSTPDATDPTGATEISSSRWTKLIGAGLFNNCDEICMISSQEVIALFIKTAANYYYPLIAGPFIVADDDLGGEAGDNGRIYAISGCGNTSGQVTGMWESETVGPFAYSANFAGYPKTIAFDPRDPTTRIGVKRMTTIATAYMALADFCEDDRGGTTYLNSLVIPIGETTNFGTGTAGAKRRLGTLRQISPGQYKAGFGQIKNGAGGTVQATIWAINKTSSLQTVSFNNG